MRLRKFGEWNKKLKQTRYGFMYTGHYIKNMLFNVSISTQSRLATLLSSLFARFGSFYGLYDGSYLKTYLLMRW